MTQSSLTVGLLYPGEMGSTLAALLRSRGIRVVTTLAGRSPRTTKLSRDAGVIELDSLAEVVRQSAIVMSLVPPAAAEEVADAYCEVAHLSPPSALYVDVNAISPELAELLSLRVTGAGRQFVDAAVNGLARTIVTGGTLFLSGPRAGDVAELFGDQMHVRVLGDRAGLASAMKMLLSGVSKGACALFLELALLAHRRGMLGEMIDEVSRIYPGIATVVARMLPTIPQHRLRRAGEMRELEETAHAAQATCLIRAIREMYDQLASLPLDTCPHPDGWSVTLLIEHLVDEGFLAGVSPAPQRTVSAACS